MQTVSDKEDRIRNVIVYGLEESDEEALEEEVQIMLKQIEEKPVIRDCCRGIGKLDNRRPIKFTLRSSDIRILSTRQGENPCQVFRVL